MHSAGEDTDLGAVGVKTSFDQQQGDENREETEEEVIRRQFVFNMAVSGEDNRDEPRLRSRTPRSSPPACRAVQTHL